jgi:SpoVK/Ycf46/Vps4 family AAA+-type ATPase
MPVDLSGALKVAIDNRLVEAERKSASGDFLEASHLYRECAVLMKQYAEQTPFPAIREQRRHFALVYEERASGLLPSNDTPLDDRKIIPDETSLKEDILQFVQRSSVTWEDIGGLDRTKEDIKTAYGMGIAKKPKGVRLEGWRTILFYGPPGTGKTLLAAAMSNGINAMFFNVALGGILSKYFGESSKLISTLYSEARKSAPSVIYFDEIDALSAQRSGDETGAERRVLSSLLTELDGLANKSDSRYVLTIAATNLPWLLDKALLSRFSKKVFVPLPDEKTRESILHILLSRRGIDSDVSYQELAAMTEGYSGRELERISQEAVSRMVKELNPQITELVDRGFDAVNSYELKLRPVIRHDFEAALAKIKPEISGSNLRRFVEWDNSLNQ